MGIVYSANRALVANYIEETATIRDILIEPGRPEASVKLAPLTSLEVDRIIKKLDTLVMQLASPAIATIVAEEIQAILVAIRMCKTETKEDFMGLLSAGSNLDICWLRPEHIGSSLLSTGGTSSTGLYAGTGGEVLTWLHNFTAITATDIVPSQIMKEECTLIHLGAINPIEDPKVESIMFYLAGIPTPAQSLEFRVRKSFGTYDIPIVRFEKPIIIGPEKTQRIAIKPFVTGNDRCQLISLLVAKSEDMVLAP